eukprot:CAMPEP_0119563802 /NCGR_PEP_ID=MMETSP1352-20130426/24788_1 /TAXON_ID=265584 /ORGANISM="Stauroneis constricta, Strain CCMP1120" /LENGTH=740 /DNA_ID=CAMNT_0007612471 /DNA_START=425 /DNA_END=2644 /DNA_ORIENTATION=+
MGCCESVPEDAVEGHHKGGNGATSRSSKNAGPETSLNASHQQKALRKIDQSEKPEEIVCGGLRLRYAFLSQRGYYPDDPHKPNQDAYSISTRFGNQDTDAHFAVYDGHGRDGDLCAQFARDKMPSYLTRHINRHKQKEAQKHKNQLERMAAASNPDEPFNPLNHVELGKDQMQQACLKAHVECNQAMHQDPSLDDSLSGSTAISVFVHGKRNRITVCNVGDSRAVVGKANPGGSPDSKTFKALPLSRDQTPYRKDERIRIKATGARILSLDQLEGLEPITNEDSQNEEGELELGEELDEGGDPPRVWSPNGDYPGTAFTRSLGDAMAEELGVYAEPEMLTRDIRPEDRVIVLASDGIFEFLTNQSVIDICAKFTDPLEACRAVVAESYELWLQYELRTDDITIIVMFVDTVADASRMDRTYVTSSLRDMQYQKQISMGRMPVEKEEEQAVGTEGLRPIRVRMTKEKAQAIEKLKRDVLEDEDYTALMNQEVDLDELYTEKSSAEKARIANAIKTSVMFRNVTEEQREMIFGVMEPIPVKKGTWVIRQGTVGDRFYIIDEGKFEVRILGDGERDDGTGGTLIHVYEGSVAKNAHPCFGELALMYSAPRSASIIARSDGHLWGLHRSAFRQVLAQAQGTRKELAVTLGKISMFAELEQEEINKLAASFDEIAFGRGENIIEQGHFGDSMFVITSGTCELVRVIGGQPKSSTLKAGDYFGNEVIIDQQKYGSTVVSLQTITGW